VNCYYNAFTRHQELLTEHQQPNANIALVSNFMCAPTDEEALARADGATFFAFALQWYGKNGPVKSGTVNLWEEYLVFRETPEGQKMHRARGLIGSPDTIRRRLRKFQESHVDQVILLNQAGKTTHADIMSSLQLFADEVMDEFHDGEAEHQEWKSGVLSGQIELEQIDTSPFNFRTSAAPTKKASTTV
jgi:alkanesulfonate monooxygenase SsuD/methylene tetrahydromethanopterin reductase-like flavin-dependent oxidoreductase (luciferase family)